MEHLKNLNPSEFAEKILPLVSYSQYTYDYISLDVTMSNDEKSIFVLKTNFLISKFDLVTGFFLDHMILPTVSEWRNEMVLKNLKEEQKEKEGIDDDLDDAITEMDELDGRTEQRRN